ncbi:MAG: thioesterase family protein [Bacteroidetes bacterium]|jgi:acyl-CoA thioester hydrolase|nr:thioesterase family protein [Bacteroidota bacterium]
MFRHKAQIQIRFCDTDMLGHVNNANYLSYMEMARVSYFNEVMPKLDWSGQGIILAKAEISYKAPLFLEDNLFIYTGVEQISGKSFMMRYRFMKKTEAGELLAAEGSTLMVCYDYRENHSIPVPDFWKKAIEFYEEGLG